MISKIEQLRVNNKVSEIFGSLELGLVSPQGLGRPGGRDKESPSGQLRYFPGEKAEA